MPYTPKQRRFFHEAAEDPEVARQHGLNQHEAGRLADEADKLKKKGEEKTAKAIIDLTPVLGPRA